MESGEKIAVLHDHNPNYAPYIIALILIWVLFTEIVCHFIKKQELRKLSEIKESMGVLPVPEETEAEGEEEYDVDYGIFPWDIVIRGISAILLSIFLVFLMLNYFR